MALHPPVRTVPGNYHYHVYDYANSAVRGPWELSDAVPSAGLAQFYSMRQDLSGLLAEGQGRNVPNIRLISIGPLNSHGRYTLGLAFGNQTGQRNQRTVVITGGIHAREWIATEMAYLLAEYLIFNYVANPPPGNPRVKALRNLVNNRNIVIIPMLNPDGISRTVYGTMDNARLWRKNIRALPGTAANWVRLIAPGGQENEPYQNAVAPPGEQAQYDVPTYVPVPQIPPLPLVYGTVELENGETGVDLNRNLPTIAYGYDSAADDDDDDDEGYADSRAESYTFHGPGGASEREIANLRNAVLQATARAATGSRVWAAIDYHSYGKKILYGEEAIRTGLAAAHTALGQTLQSLIRDQNGPSYALQDPGAAALLGYLPVGSVDDYMTQDHQALAFTVELDPGDEDPEEFELPEDQILNVFRQNIRGALAAISAPVNALEAQRAVNSYIGWNVYNAGNQVP
jgi:hypothetical protein